MAALQDQIENLQKNGLSILTAEIISITGSFSDETICRCSV